jgi:hypothetical protein
VFENRVLRRVFGRKRDGVTGDWRKLLVHNEGLSDRHSSPNIVPVIISRMSWAWHVARIGEANTGFSWVNFREKTTWKAKV